MRHQPRDGFDIEQDAPPTQNAKCLRCGTLLTFTTNGMGVVIETCSHCDSGIYQPIYNRARSSERMRGLR